MKFVKPIDGEEYLNMSGKPTSHDKGSSSTDNHVIDIEAAKRAGAANAIRKFILLAVFLGGVFFVFIFPALASVGVIRLW